MDSELSDMMLRQTGASLNRHRTKLSRRPYATLLLVRPEMLTTTATGDASPTEALAYDFAPGACHATI